MIVFRVMAVLAALGLLSVAAALVQCTSTAVGMLSF